MVGRHAGTMGCRPGHCGCEWVQRVQVGAWGGVCCPHTNCLVEVRLLEVGRRKLSGCATKGRTRLAIHSPFVQPRKPGVASGAPLAECQGPAGYFGWSELKEGKRWGWREAAVEPHPSAAARTCTPRLTLRVWFVAVMAACLVLASISCMNAALSHTQVACVRVCGVQRLEQIDVALAPVLRTTPPPCSTPSNPSSQQAAPHPPQLLAAMKAKHTPAPPPALTSLLNGLSLQQPITTDGLRECGPAPSYDPPCPFASPLCPDRSCGQSAPLGLHHHCA